MVTAAPPAIIIVVVRVKSGTDENPTVTDYRGLSVTELQGFRRNLRPAGADFRIAKNTLTRIAADRVGIEGLEPLLEGTTVLVLVNDWYSSTVWGGTWNTVLL